MSEPQSGADVLARIRPVMREEATYLCLRPDLLDRWEDLNKQLVTQQARDHGDTEDGPRRRLGQGVSQSASDLAEEIQQVEDEIEATQVKFTLRAMSKHKWRELTDKYPPRKGNQYDLMLGYDPQSVWDDAVRECLIDPDFDDKSWSEFMQVCNPSEWDELVGVTRSVNRSVVDVPKSELASRILARRSDGSGQRDRGAPRRGSSTAGRAKKSTSTTTPKDA